jgi:hypothetical protein
MAGATWVRVEGQEMVACYCCGKQVDPATLVRFHEHPNQGVCAGCATYLHRRAVAAEREARRPFWRRS